MSGAATVVTRLRPFVGSPLNIAVTCASLVVIAWALPPLLRWAVFDAAWSGTSRDCATAAGACWIYVADKASFFIFGFYPAPERWRASLAMLAMGGVIGASTIPQFWRKGLLACWAGVLILVLWLLGGGPGLSPVATDNWGGLPLTLFLATFGLAAGFPVGVLLALGRTSSLPLFRWLCTGLIELQRGVPFISLLFMASVMLPLFLPEQITPTKLARAEIAFVLVTGAYIAEVVRGGLQGVPRAQYEAAAALGLGYWRMVWLISLPQALRISVPGLVNVGVVFFKDTSLVVAIGLTDLLAAVSSGARDTEWLGHDVEGYLFAAMVYFVFCSCMSRYAAWLERRLRTRHDRVATGIVTPSEPEPAR
jgi:general L-amino acid transport system permease protein